jgi:hypothetical protein
MAGTSRTTGQRRMTIPPIHQLGMDNEHLPPRYIRALIGGRLHEELRYLSIRLRRPIVELLPEAVTLLVRHYHGDEAPMVRERTTRTRVPK